MTNIIYWFSGTGNSLWLAKSIAEQLGNAAVSPIMALKDNPEIPADCERVGFIFPTCFMHPPKVVMEIGEFLRFSPQHKAFIVVTCGGGNGFTMSDFAKLIQPKLQSCVQGFEIPLPGNHLIGFGAWPQERQQQMFDDASKAVNIAVQKIQNDLPTKIKKPPSVRLMTWMSQRFNGRLGIKDIFSTDAEYYVTDACKRCGTCEKLCPVGNITIAEGNVTFGKNCQQCMACIQWCPERAVAHPNVPEDRARYHHPEITVEDMLSKK